MDQAENKIDDNTIGGSVKKDILGNEIQDGAEVSWENLSYKIHSKSSLFRNLTTKFLPWKRKKKKDTGKDTGKESKEKILLQPFSGTIKPNSLVAVMGSSGAGKTTFLNVLSYQFESGVREGNVFLNHRKLSKKLFKKTCGYVRQNDVLLPNLTVRETLTFYANMLLPFSTPRSEISHRVLSTIKKLGLAHCMNTRIGNDFKRGISGGEKRRVTIAIELLKNPAVLFLDEPTSGLDSKTALSLINTLSELAHDYNHTIICTIHQPRSQIFSQFDTLLLLAKGSPVYFGPANEAIDYFAKKGYHCPQYENPPDFFIDLLTVDTDTQEKFEESTRRINYLIECSKLEHHNNNYNRDDDSSHSLFQYNENDSHLLYQNHNNNINNNININNNSINNDNNNNNMSNNNVDGNDEELEDRERGISAPPSQIKGKEPRAFGTSLPYQIWLLFDRSVTNKWRDTQYLFGRVAQTFFMAFAVSILWWQIDTDQLSIQDRISVLFIILLGSAFSEGLVASLVFPMDRLVYIQEKRAGVYSVFSYYIAKQLAEFPLQLLVPTIFIVIVYLTVGLQYNVIHFGNLLLICLLLNFIVNSFGLLFGALFQAQLAAVLMPVCLIFTMLFAGFYVNTANIPVWLRWAKYASMFYYGFSGIIYVEFWGRSFYCKEGQELVLTGTGTCPNGDEIEVTTSLCPITHGQQIIDQFGSDAFALYQIELILLGFLILLRFLLFFALLNPPKRV